MDTPFSQHTSFFKAVFAYSNRAFVDVAVSGLLAVAAFVQQLLEREKQYYKECAKWLFFAQLLK